LIALQVQHYQVPQVKDIVQAQAMDIVQAQVVKVIAQAQVMDIVQVHLQVPVPAQAQVVLQV
jgi:hypothetical protein